MDITSDRYDLLSSDGTKITAYDHGGTGEPIIFLHYLGGIAQLWQPVIKHFIQNHRVITYDLRGHGKSDQPEEGYTFEDTAKDLDTVLDHFKVNKAHLVGSSYGCMVGLYYASNRKDRVLSLVQCDGAMINNTGDNGLYEETLEEHLAKFKDQFDSDYESVEAYKQFYRDNWEPWNESRAFYVEQYEPRIKKNGKVGPRTKRETLEKIISELYYVDFLTWYEKVKCPVLFLPAEQEGHLEKTKEFLGKVSKVLPYCKTIIISGTIHLMMYDHEEKLIEAIQLFYKELPVNTSPAK
ncbi:alpha/beta hydrolase [Bacillus sp. NEB1478]|uniref:alpha/beta fold hydrolase n=1 Tax=Bacillus sp. NEB1478 TaxID=3073816 RepID=UPI002873192B|nr:alpha/beta hydrolase [Bacillus sp. NEB1478]WNB90804.1 alpha/beta hydrolase [Bacillus sp. NEB1478]